jgi:hypothetical protein
MPEKKIKNSRKLSKESKSYREYTGDSVEKRDGGKPGASM